MKSLKSIKLTDNGVVKTYTDDADEAEDAAERVTRAAAMAKVARRDALALHKRAANAPHRWWGRL